MSTSIHAVIEYQDKVSKDIVWSLGEIHMGVSFSDIFALLGAQGHNYKRTVVPKRGWPMEGDLYGLRSHDADRILTLLVDPYVTERETESDGTVITETDSQYYQNLKGGNASIVLSDRYTGMRDYRWYRISDPDIHSVNWITADELEVAVNATSGHLYAYRAAIAAMRVLAADESIEWVRLIYGFDN